MTAPYTHIDPAILLSLVDGDVGAFIQLSETFLSIAPPLFRSLEMSLAGDDCRAIADRAHGLKGTTTLVGALALTEQLAVLESSMRQNLRHAAPPAQALLPAFHAVLQEVAASIVAMKNPDTRKDLT